MNQNNNIENIKCCATNCNKKATTISTPKDDVYGAAYFCDEHIKEYEFDLYDNRPLYIK